jgi:hypothetical protein
MIQYEAKCLAAICEGSAYLTLITATRHGSDSWFSLIKIGNKFAVYKTLLQGSFFSSIVFMKTWSIDWDYMWDKIKFNKQTFSFHDESCYFSLKAWRARHFSNKWVRNSQKYTRSKGIKLIIKTTYYNQIWGLLLLLNTVHYSLLLLPQGSSECSLTRLSDCALSCCWWMSVNLL